MHAISRVKAALWSRASFELHPYIPPLLPRVATYTNTREFMVTPRQHILATQKKIGAESF